MQLNVLKDLKRIYSGLNPDEIRGLASRNIQVGLVASSDEMYRRMEAFLAPSGSDLRALRAISNVGPGVTGDVAGRYDFLLCEPGVPVPRNGYLFESGDSDSLAKLILNEHSKLELALARTFPSLRAAASSRLIHHFSQENALFALVTALPNVVPSVIDVPWAVGEFATDTAFLTMNQIRMALQLAAAHGQPVGYSEQKMQLATIIGGAFGWRALARELVGKIPLGGGLIPKASIAFAGTYVVGLGLEKLNRTGAGMSRKQGREAYQLAYQHGKKLATELAKDRLS